MDEILLNVESKEIRYAHLQNGQLHDLIIERKKARQLTGNIYRGRVTNILHNIQSAFIDISEGENGFIHISDIMENTKKLEELFDMDFDLDYDIAQLDTNNTKDLEISQCLKIDQPVLVQVVKEPIGNKGARLTSNISIAGRYLVLLPNATHRGVSRKIEDRQDRDRLKHIIRAFDMPQDMGLICRTASKNASTEMLVDEAHELLLQWKQIIQQFEEASGPSCLYEETDLVKKAVVTAIDHKFSRLLVDHYPTYLTCKNLYQRYSGEHLLKIELYRDKIPMFERFTVEREIDKALGRKIWLSSGGYLFFDRTEAMHTIDVNSGKSSSGTQDVEETLVKINLEAAEEITRQLRLRNTGGLIICDFIDMRSRRNQRRVFNKLKECMKADFAKYTILGMSEFGLVEMTRQRSRESLAQTMLIECPYCSGCGQIKSHESVSIEIERALKKIIGSFKQFALQLTVHPNLHAYLEEHGDAQFILDFAEELNARLSITTNDALHLNEYHFYSTINGERIDI